MADKGDAFRTAEALLRLYGDRAELEAREIWRLHKSAGATNAARVWQRVLDTIAALRARRRPLLH